MLNTLRSVFLALVVMIVSLFAAAMQPAIAQSRNSASPLIQASWVYTYARYYAPYAIQAAAAYLPVSNFDATRTQPAQDGYGADVNYTVLNVFSDEKIRSRAREAFRAWQYQFGSDSYLTCYDPTDSYCQEAYRKRNWLALGGGPAFQVWARTRFPHSEREVCTEVSIAFRGTTGVLSDWTSNAHQLAGSLVDDYYHQLRRNIDGIISSIKDLDCYKRAKFKPQIVSTGHSLGGGLAQLAALADKPSGPRIAKVFAFDPSPVTGANLVKAEIRLANAKGLTIDRIYQEGEVLSRYLSLDQQYPPSSSGCDPLVRTVRVDAIPSNSSIQLHGMTALATQMVQLSYNGDTPLAYQAPSSPITCQVRYRSPPTEDGVFAADAGARQTLYASARSRRGYVNQLAALYSFEVQQSVSAKKLTRVRIHRAAIISHGHKSKKFRVANS